MAGTEPFAALDRILLAGGSAYRYRKGRLEQRTEDATVAAYEQAMSTGSDEVRMYLHRAWSATYGLKPNPSHAYADAIRAVEAVACPLILPKDPKPTLGKVISRLCKRPNDWNLILPGAKDASGITPLRQMMQLIWTNQRSRHGGGPDTREQLITETEAALSFAVTLVQWFVSGFIRSVETQPQSHGG